MCPPCYHGGGSLLHCLSTLTPAMKCGPSDCWAILSTRHSPYASRSAVPRIAAQSSVHGIRRMHPEVRSLGLLRNPQYTAFAVYIRQVKSVCKQACNSLTLPYVHFSLLTRYISVALVWELPPPDVIRHPAL